MALTVLATLYPPWFRWHRLHGRGKGSVYLIKLLTCATRGGALSSHVCMMPQSTGCGWESCKRGSGLVLCIEFLDGYTWRLVSYDEFRRCRGNVAPTFGVLEVLCQQLFCHFEDVDETINGLKALCKPCILEMARPRRCTTQ